MLFEILRTAYSLSKQDVNHNLEIDCRFLSQDKGFANLYDE